MRQSMEDRKKEIINKVTAFIKKNHHFPKKDELVKIECSEGKISKYFGTVYNLEKIIGITHEKRNYSKGLVTNEMIINEVNALYNQLGYPPHPTDYPRYATARNRFGGDWHQVLKACHIKATFENGAKSHSKEELIFKGKEIIKKYGRFPTWAELKKEHFPTAQIKVYWGTLSNFAKEFNSLTLSDQKYYDDKKMYIQAVKCLSKKKDIIRTKDICNYTHTTIEYLWLFLERQVTRGELKNKSIIEFIMKNGGRAADRNTIINGVKYASFKEAAQALHISCEALKSRIELMGNNSPWLTYKGTITKKSIIRINNKVYPSLPAAAKANNMSLATLRNRLYKFGNNSNKLFSKDYVYFSKTPKAPVIINNVKYQDITSASRSLNVSLLTLQHRLQVYGNNDPRIVKPTKRI